MSRGFRFSLLFVCAAASLQAQSTFATLTGTVIDPSGAAVAGATIEATQIQTNFKYTATTGESGSYTISNANPGTYLVRFQASGFQEYRLDGIVLGPREERRVDATLKVGSVDTVIEVEGGATLIETESARIADIRSREQLRALPLTLRNIDGRAGGEGETVADAARALGLFGSLPSNSEPAPAASLQSAKAPPLPLGGAETSHACSPARPSAIHSPATLP